MSNENEITKRVALAFFSGTGCTKEVCDLFEKQLTLRGFTCTKVNMAVCEPETMKDCNLIMIFAPVYAFRLASFAEKWVSKLPEVEETSAVIISVSGGGEVSPNTACRIKSKRLLAKKGYSVIYEDMIMMPSNFATQAEQTINYGLLNILPEKVSHIIANIISGQKRITKPILKDRFFSSIGRAEHIGARFFGASIHANSSCTKCNLCINNCPNKNIKMVKGAPRFGFNCTWCLKCIYSCPCNSLSPGILKFAILKDGFDIKKMKEAAAQYTDQVEISKKQSTLWKGVADYLNS